MAVLEDIGIHKKHEELVIVEKLGFVENQLEG